LVSPEEEYFRVIERNGDDVLVHWWYFPDSYDTWCSGDADTNIDPAPEKRACFGLRLLIRT
jgi:SWI/SNF related-matrix-associated actin-dependent regulator of chromatin subfamily C